MWPNINTTLSRWACFRVILHSKSMLPWKQIHMEAVPCCCSETHPAARGSHPNGVSPSMFLVAQWCLSLSLLLLKGLGIYAHSEWNPARCDSVPFFFAAAESMNPSSALQRRAQLGLVLRLGSGLHLKLSIPDYFSFYNHIPCPSHLMWLAGW